jgi:hypothetical protein
MKKYGVTVHKLEAVNLPFGGQINIAFFIDWADEVRLLRGSV